MLREWIRGPVLDSHLYTAERNAHRNADLIFILSVYLNRVEPGYDEPYTMQEPRHAESRRTGVYADAMGGHTKIQNWPDHEWVDFRREFYNQVMGFFKKRFWLVPPRDYTGLDWPDARPTHRPNVKCGLTLWLHERPEHARVGINCIYPVPGQTLRSSMNPRDLSGELDVGDPTFQDQRPVAGEVQTQAVVVHEVGHLLGLSHVNRYASSCSGSDHNAVACYGTTAWQRGDLMGWGSRVELWHSWPWRDRIRYHTGVGGWTAVMARPDPRPLASGPGRDAGVGSLDAGRPAQGGIRDAGV